MIITSKYTIRIVHEKFGELINETFVDGTQFKLFLKMTQACLELKNDLTFFNGTDFLIHIPFKHLVDSIVITSTDEHSVTDQVRSKIEAIVTR
jgi:hypothetical protein